jgi:hypothetical protein
MIRHGIELTIVTELRDNVLHVDASGQFTLQDALRLLKKVCDEAKNAGVRKILADCLGMNGELSTLERYELAVELGNHRTEQQSAPYLAIVGQPPTINGFAVKVARNREMAVEVFLNADEASRWLAIWPD